VVTCLNRCVIRPISPRLLALLAVEAAPGDRGRSGRTEDERLFSSTDLLEDVSLKSNDDNCGVGFLGVDNSVPVGSLVAARAVPGACSDLGVEDVGGRWTRLRCEDCEESEAVEP
jgi:hypothetical protein